MASKKDNKAEVFQQKLKIESLENEVKVLKAAIVRVMDDFIKIAKISDIRLPDYMSEHKTTNMLVSFLDILAEELKKFHMLEAKVKQGEERLREASTTNSDILTMQECLEDQILEMLALTTLTDMKAKVREIIKDFEIKPRDPPVSKYKEKQQNLTKFKEKQSTETNFKDEQPKQKKLKERLCLRKSKDYSENEGEDDDVIEDFHEDETIEEVESTSDSEKPIDNSIKTEATETVQWLDEVATIPAIDDEDTRGYDTPLLVDGMDVMRGYDTPLLADGMDVALDIKQEAVKVKVEPLVPMEEALQEDDTESDANGTLLNEVGKNVCKWCNKIFKKPSLLTYHIRIHTGEKPFKCSVCGMAFAQRARLKIHMRTHTGERPYKCPTCDKAFCRQGDFRIHLRIHNKDDQFKCDNCDASFTRRKYLRIHSRVHTGQKPYMCQECGKSFMRSGSLKIHMKYIHKINFDENQIHQNRLKIKCNICDKLMNKSGMKKHMATHTGDKPYTCHLCGTSFVQKGNLDYHVKWHANEKAFKCEFCDKSFIRNGDLNHHMKCHRMEETGKKQPSFMCDICGKCLSGRLILESHISMHSGEKTHSCDMCDKKFYSSKSMMEHQRHMHKKKKMHQCDFCGKVLAHIGSLRSHRMTHTGEKPFECKECGARFRKSGTLQGHMVIHTGETPFKCDRCGERFRHRQQLYWHKDKCIIDRNETEVAVKFY